MTSSAFYSSTQIKLVNEKRHEGFVLQDAASNQPHAVPAVNPSVCSPGIQRKEPLRLEGRSAIHQSFTRDCVDFKGGCWFEDKTKLMMDEFGLRSQSSFSPEPKFFRTNFCLEQSSVVWKVKGEEGIYGQGCPPGIALARSSHSYLCFLILSRPTIKLFHNTSSDSSNYVKIFKPSSHLLPRLVMTSFSQMVLSSRFF